MVPLLDLRASLLTMLVPQLSPDSQCVDVTMGRIRGEPQQRDIVVGELELSLGAK